MVKWKIDLKSIIQVFQLSFLGTYSRIDCHSSCSGDEGSWSSMCSGDEGSWGSRGCGDEGSRRSCCSFNLKKQLWHLTFKKAQLWHLTLAILAHLALLCHLTTLVRAAVEKGWHSADIITRVASTPSATQCLVQLGYLKHLAPEEPVWGSFANNNFRVGTEAQVYIRFCRILARNKKKNKDTKLHFLFFFSSKLL